MTAAIRAPRPATYADIEALPPHLVGEIVAGVLHTQPRPLVRHVRAAGVLFGELYQRFENSIGGPGGWIFMQEPELHLGADVVVPDIAGWHATRAPVYDDDPFITVAPDWVCEVLSPRTERFDRNEKRMVYAREGVGHLWLANPQEKFVEAFVNTAGHWLLVATATGEGDLCLPPFEAAPFPLPLLWPLAAASDAEASA